LVAFRFLVLALRNQVEVTNIEMMRKPDVVNKVILTPFKAVLTPLNPAVETTV